MLVGAIFIAQTNPKGASMKQKIAVSNFLNTMDLSMRKSDQIKNAILDSALYKWNSATYMAVLEGIDKAYAQKRYDELNGEKESSA